jgi:hypothetical protein
MAELKPLGCKPTARVMDYPGRVQLFLSELGSLDTGRRHHDVAACLPAPSSR